MWYDTEVRITCKLPADTWGKQQEFAFEIYEWPIFPHFVQIHAILFIGCAVLFHRNLAAIEVSVQAVRYQNKYRIEYQIESSVKRLTFIRSDTAMDLTQCRKFFFEWSVHTDIARTNKIYRFIDFFIYCAVIRRVFCWKINQIFACLKIECFVWLNPKTCENFGEILSTCFVEGAWVLKISGKLKKGLFALHRWTSFWTFQQKRVLRRRK